MALRTGTAEPPAAEDRRVNLSHMLQAPETETELKLPPPAKKAQDRMKWLQIDP